MLDPIPGHLAGSLAFDHGLHGRLQVLLGLIRCWPSSLIPLYRLYPWVWFLPVGPYVGGLLSYC